jgi:hypothetical protein
MCDKKSLVPDAFSSEDTKPLTAESEAGKELAKLRERLRREKLRRIVFAFDATGSRGPVWDLAQSIQARMLEDTLEYGDVEMQVVAYRDRMVDPNDYIEYSKWSKDGEYLREFMGTISCHGGGANDGESVDEALAYIAAQEPEVHAVILVGDEPVLSDKRQRAYELARKLGKKRIPVFTFYEGDLPQTRIDFENIAETSGGICDELTSDAQIDFGDRLRVVAVYATGGAKAIEDFIGKHGSGDHEISQGAKRLAERLIKHSEMKELE